MKRALTLAAALLMVVAVTVPASAEMVNLGLVEMDNAEVEHLQGLVSGSKTFASTNPAAETQASEDLGLISMSADDSADIQNYVSGRTEFNASTGRVSGEKMGRADLVGVSDSDLDTMANMASQGRAQRLATLNALLHN